MEHTNQRHHANAVQLEHKGVLIYGPSGCGKSALSLALIERAPLFGRKGVLIADDYCDLIIDNQQLLAQVPDTLRGGMEIRGAGLFALEYEPQTMLHLAVELGDNTHRMPENAFFTYESVSIPLLKLPALQQTDMICLCQAIEAYLFKTPWQLQDNL